MFEQQQNLEIIVHGNANSSLHDFLVVTLDAIVTGRMNAFSFHCYAIATNFNRIYSAKTIFHLAFSHRNSFGTFSEAFPLIVFFFFNFVAHCMNANEHICTEESTVIHLAAELFSGCNELIFQIFDLFARSYCCKCEAHTMWHEVECNREMCNCCC